MSDQKEYWNKYFVSLDEPTERHYEAAALSMDECMALVGHVSPEYGKHVFQYRSEARLGFNGSSELQNCYVVGSCCIVGDLPEKVTSKPEFKEIPWPTR